MIIVYFEDSDRIVTTVRNVDVFAIVANVNGSSTVVFSEVVWNSLVGSNIFEVPGVFIELDYVNPAGKFTNNVEVVAVFRKDNVTITKTCFVLVLC